MTAANVLEGHAHFILLKKNTVDSDLDTASTGGLRICTADRAVALPGSFVPKVRRNSQAVNLWVGGVAQRSLIVTFPIKFLRFRTYYEVNR